MATNQVQLRRDTATNLNAATPVDGELGYDTTNDQLVIGDGTTAGGIKIPSAKHIQTQSMVYGTVGGTANAITLTSSPPVLAYVNGLKLSFKATATNSAATTVNVAGLGVKNIYKLSGASLVALSGNEIVSGAIYDITYDGTQFQLTNSTGSGTVGMQVFTASGTYTPSANMRYCEVEAVGGGAGGGGGSSATNRGAGGGAGGYSRAIYTAAAIGASKSVTIGAGGAGGTAGGSGSAGGSTLFGATITCAGGTGGAGGAGPNIGEVGGSASGGTFNCYGGDGGSSVDSGNAGNGGASFFGGGGRGGTGAGGTGLCYGSGGGGATGVADGGVGGAGAVIVREYF